ncbi:MAG: type II toxin-antitoxin system RatA family toxin [Burkholderiaceae bacterium]
MPHVDRSLLVHYSAEQMFELVADVEHYPQFLPWCSGSRVVRDREGGADATVELDYRGIKSHFTTRNDLRFPEQIRMSLLDGPFRSLTGHWSFIALRPGACKVQLTLHYEFASSLLGRALAPVFEHVAHSMIESFESRAEQVYGPH